MAHTGVLGLNSGPLQVQPSQALLFRLTLLVSRHDTSL